MNDESDLRRKRRKTKTFNIKFCVSFAYLHHTICVVTNFLKFILECLLLKLVHKISFISFCDPTKNGKF